MASSDLAELITRGNSDKVLPAMQMSSLRPSPLHSAEPVLNDPLSYLDSVKVRLSEDPIIYNRFLDIMKDYRSQRIDTPYFIGSVTELFNRYPDLIQSFNIFISHAGGIQRGPDDKVMTKLETVANFAPHGSIQDEYNDGRENLTRPLPTKEQLGILEAHFQAQPKPNITVKRQLAMRTQLTLPRVAVSGA